MKKRLTAILLALAMLLPLSACDSAAELALIYRLGSALLDYKKDRADYNDLARQALAGLADADATPAPDLPEDPGTEQPTSRATAPRTSMTGTR